MSYQDELARALARREAEAEERKLTVSARRLLRVAGWDATADELREAAKSLPKEDPIEPELLDPAIARALELQADENVRGRRIRPEEVGMPRRVFTSQERENIREYVRKRRRDDPTLTPPVLHVDVCELFGPITIENFRATYWNKSDPREHRAEPYRHVNGLNPRPSTNGKGGKKRAAKKSAPPKKRAAVTTAPHQEVLAAPSTSVVHGAPHVVGGPLLTVYRLSDGRVRLQADLDLDELSRVLHEITSREN